MADHSTDLGRCSCGAIHFTCPACGRKHDRGWFNGVDVFRCLHCDYVGHGFHQDPEVDREVGQEIRENQQWNREHGLPEGPFLP